MKVSVCMLTYNHAPFIAQAIESVLMQKTDFEYDLVIGEDCSTDGTRRIVEKYARRYPQRIKTLLRKPNVGMTRNFVDTVAHCQGTGIAFCEGDDYWHRTDKLQIQAAFLDHNSACAFVCSDYDALSGATGRRIRGWNRKHGANPAQITDLKYILRGTPTSGIMTCTVMARRECLVQAMKSHPRVFNAEEQPCLDTPLWMALAQLGRIGYLAESLATYRQLVQSATHDPSVAKVLRTSISMKQQMLRLVDEYQLSVTEKSLHIEDLWRRRLKLACYERNWEQAAEAKSRLGTLSAVEWLQFWGASTTGANRIVRAILPFLCRDCIPTVKKT